MTCAEILRRFTAYTTASKTLDEADAKSLNEAKEHIATCRRCVQNLDILAVVAGLPDEEELLRERMARISPCWKCQELLPVFIDHEFYGEPDNEDSVWVGKHINTCSDCREEYESVSEMVLVDARGFLGIPQRTNIEIWRTAKDGFRVLKSQISALVTGSMIEVAIGAQALHSLQLKPSVVRRRRATVLDDVGYLIPIPAPDGGQIQVNILLRTRGGGEASLTVEVVNVSTSSPVSGVYVALYRSTGERRSILRGLETNEIGEVNIELTLGRYEMDVIHEELQLRFPIGIERSN